MVVMSTVIVASVVVGVMVAGAAVVVSHDRSLLATGLRRGLHPGGPVPGSAPR
jgi:hypothetical protein